MILGIGTDLCDIRRIRTALERHGDKFYTKIFTEIECKNAEKSLHKAASLAKRWAAKEACAKALGTGFLRSGVFWRDIEIDNLLTGQPFVRLSNGSARRLDKIIPGGLSATIHLSTSDDGDWAQAFVVIEAS